MRNALKRSLSLILALVMVVSMTLPAPCGADETGRAAGFTGGNRCHERRGLYGGELDGIEICQGFYI